MGNVVGENMWANLLSCFYKRSDEQQNVDFFKNSIVSVTVKVMCYAENRLFENVLPHSHKCVLSYFISGTELHPFFSI